MRLDLTKQAGHVIRAMVWLAETEAQSQTGEPTSRQTAAAIASAVGIPPAFAARLLAQLRRRDLLRARAGQQGGYTLARPASEISLLEVIEAAEGPLLSHECLLRDSSCGTTDYCVLHTAWSAAQEALRTVLSQVSLAEAFSRRELAEFRDGTDHVQHRLHVDLQYRSESQKVEGEVTEHGTISLVLESEHQWIDARFEQFRQDLAQGQVNPGPFHEAAKTLHRHIYLEEEILFPEVEVRGLVGPTAAMLEEHGEICRFLDSIRDLIGENAHPRRVSDTLKTLRSYLQEHNFREERVLYPSADQLLDQDQLVRVLQRLQGATPPKGWVCRAHCA